MIPLISDHPKSLSSFNNKIINTTEKNYHTLIEDTCSQNYKETSIVNNKSYIRNYIQYLSHHITDDNDKELSSFYFKQGYGLLANEVDQIFDSLDKFLAENKANFGRQTIQSGVFEIEIKSKNDLEYAIKLNSIHNNIIKPYIQMNKDKLIKYGGTFDRFYKIVDMPSDVFGKTMHNTKSTFELTLHHPLIYLNPSEFKSKYTVLYELGYTTHFRNFNNWTFKKINIKQIHFDLNYFNCFFKPILNELINDSKMK
jgi:hypothetical protein